MYTLHHSSHLLRTSPPFTFIPKPPHLLPIICKEGGNNNSNNNNNNTPPQPPPITPPNTVEIRFRRGSKRRQRQQQLQNLEDIEIPKGGGGVGIKTQTSSPLPPKKWEDMSFSEKALELYVGEKGALFWLNKFAYASIFIVIGGWILFRFVGPSLNLYQLDSPPLAPDAMFKG